VPPGWRAGVASAELRDGDPGASAGERAHEPQLPQLRRRARVSCPRILIIAGSDSGGGAGIQADIKTVTMLGGHAMTAVTALTAQNTLGVQRVMPVPADMVLAQIESCVRDIGVDAVKIGMLGSAETARAVSGALERLDVPIVFDPVMAATSGDALADAETIAAFGRLMSLASVVTPNTPELAALSGIAVEDEISQSDAAETLMETTSCRAVLAKGGHLRLGGYTHGADVAGKPFRYDNADRVFDVLYECSEQGWTETHFDSPRLDTRHTHGTGCTLASAIATGLGVGSNLPDATRRAIRFVQAALAAAPGLGGGHGPMGHALGVDPFAVIAAGAR